MKFKRYRYRMQDSSGLGEDSPLQASLIQTDDLLDAMGVEFWEQIHRRVSVRLMLSTLWGMMGHPNESDSVTSNQMSKFYTWLIENGESVLSELVKRMHNTNMLGTEIRLTLMFLVINLGLFKNRDTKAACRSIDDEWMSEEVDTSLPWDNPL